MSNPIGQVIKQDKFESPYHKAIINLFYTSNFVRDIHSNIFNEFNLQSQHFNVLRILKGKYPDFVQPRYIKEVMLDKGCDLTRLLDKLQKLGYLNRSFDPSNKRIVNLQLTDSGLKLITKMNVALQKLDIEFKQNMSDQEYEQLSCLLDKMRG